MHNPIAFLFFFLLTMAIAVLAAIGVHHLSTLVKKGWDAPSREEFEEFKKENLDKLDSSFEKFSIKLDDAIARIEKRTFEMAFNQGQLAERTKHKNKEDL